MVAAAKLRRAQDAISGARPFAEKLEEISGRIVGEISATGQAADKLHPLLATKTLEEGTKKKVALIVVTSDRGLCGGYNGAMIKFATRRRAELLSDKNNDVQMFFVGRRGRDFFKRRGITGHMFDDIWVGRFSTLKSDKVSDFFVGKFLSGDFDHVEVLFSQFKSAISQIPTAKVILPLKVEAQATGTNEKGVVETFIYEPKNKAEILSELLPKQVRTQFYRVLADSLASELGARMTAMDNATRNAGSMISRLTLEANRVRQASITKELMEIVSGAEALKG